MLSPPAKDSVARSDETASADASRLSADDVPRRLTSDRGVGSGASEAAKRLEKHGANEPMERAGRGRLAIVRERGS